jgi:hypothetical protein
VPECDREVSIMRRRCPGVKRHGGDYKFGGLLVKHAVSTWDLGNHHNICLKAEENQENVCRGGRSKDLPYAQ